MQALQSWAPISIWTNRPDRHACSAPRPAIDMSGLKRKWNDECVDSQRLVDPAPAKRMRLDDSHSRNACAQMTKEEVYPYTPAQFDPSAQTQASGGKDEVDATTTPAAADAVKVSSTLPSSNGVATTEHNSSKLDEARKCIEAQLNLEILLRHQELRLIEQELAKAQVSLEQLRRCHVIPFPGTPGSTATFDQISDGTGPALEPTLGHTKPSNPAPWGATDGPYSQHYAKWLIPDDSFDSTSQSLPKARLSPGGKSYTPTDARGLRGSERDITVANRRQRQSVSLKTNATLATGALPKERPAGPLKLKRSDGVWVKLVCRHCQKEDVNSVQGFLNHCRIAHSDTMRTHQEAAAAHGVVLEEDEVDTTPTLVRQTPVSATFGNNWATQPAQVHSLNAVNRRLNSQSSFTTPTRPSPPHFTDGSSEIDSSIATPMTTSYQPSPAKASSNHMTQQSKVASNQHAGSTPSAQGQRHGVTSSHNPSFKGSSDTPLLSALAQKRGYGMDLAKLVTSAQQKVDLEQVESLAGDSEDEDETSRPAATARPLMPTQSNASATRIPRQPSPLIQSTAAPAAPTQLQSSMIIPNSVSSSFDPVDDPSTITVQHRRSALKTPSPQSAAAPIVADSQIHDLSPRTAESNPGMVTDREDDLDDEDDDDEEYEEVPDSDCDGARNSGHVRVGGSQHSVRIRGEDDVDMRDPGDVDDANEAKLPLAQEAARSATQQRSGEPKRIKRARPSKRARLEAGNEGKQEKLN